MKKEELRKKLPKSSHAPQEEESTHKKELEKAYERIGVLETRVHDLTLQVSTVSSKMMHLIILMHPKEGSVNCFPILYPLIISLIYDTHCDTLPHVASHLPIKVCLLGKGHFKTWTMDLTVD